jgi:hypothetical protein
MVNVSDINTVYHYITQHILSKVVVIACEIELDKKLEKNEVFIEDLAQQCDFNPVAFMRFLRVLEAYDIVEIIEDKVRAAKLCYALAHVKGPHLLLGHKIIDKLSFSLKTNEDCYTEVVGQSFSDSVKSSPIETQRLREWADITAAQWLIPAICSHYDFLKFQKICEIGGWGHLVEFLGRKSSVIETLHIKNMEESISEDALKAFEALIFCRSLLSTSDEQAITAITKYSRCMGKNSNLFIIDYFLPEKNHPDYQLCTIADLNVLSFLNGSLRTKRQWENIISKSGLHLDFFMAIDSDQVDDAPSSVLPLLILSAKNH